MDDAGDVAQQGEQDVQPEGAAKAHLEEDAQRRQEDGDKDADQVHDDSVQVSGYLQSTAAAPRGFRLSCRAGEAASIIAGVSLPEPCPWRSPATTSTPTV